MSAIDFAALKYASFEERLLVSGYIRTNLQQEIIVSSENLVDYTILAFYHDNCDIFNTFLENYDISSDHKSLSGCGYGKYQIDPTDTRYDHYQWMFNINECKRGTYGCMFGITSIADTKVPWCYNMCSGQYNFHSRGNFIPSSDRKFDGSAYEHLFLQTNRFVTGDIIVLDLNTRTKEFKLFINERLGGCHKNIKCDRDIKYRLGCMVFDGINFVTLEGFSKFKDNKSISASNNKNNLLNYTGEFSERYHPNGIGIDYSKMWRKGFRPKGSKSILFRVYPFHHHEWIYQYYGPRYKSNTSSLFGV